MSEVVVVAPGCAHCLELAKRATRAEAMACKGCDETEAELADALVQLARLRERERIAAIREHLAHWALDADHEDVLALVPEWMKAEATAHLPHVWSDDAALTQENNQE